MRISVRVTNVETVVRNLQMKEAEAIAQAQEAIAEATQVILKEAQDTMPVVTGALRDSGATAVEVENQQIVGLVGFGNSSKNPTSGRTTASYAESAHEEPDRGKWLETPLYNYEPIYLETLANALHKVF